MVFCIVALVVFGILGIFSAKYRSLAKEAFDCAYRAATLRPCVSRLDERIKSKITAKMMVKSPALAKAFYRNFRAFSYVFVLAFFLSAGGIFYGLYNYFAFGDCNGPESNGFCIYNAISPATMSPSEIIIGDHPVRGSGNLTIIEFACLQCPYSKEAEPALRQVLNGDKVKLAFFFFPLPQHAHGKMAAAAGYCAGGQGKFWEYHDLLFEMQDKFGNEATSERALAVMMNAGKELGLDTAAFERCISSESTLKKVEADIELGNKLGITGTPTFFIGSDRLVGPKTFEQFTRIIEPKLK